MGLPEGWTAFGNKGEAISDYVRYKVIVPCAEYIFRNVYKKQLFKCNVLVTHTFLMGIRKTVWKIINNRFLKYKNKNRTAHKNNERKCYPVYSTITPVNGKMGIPEKVR